MQTIESKIKNLINNKGIQHDFISDKTNISKDRLLKCLQEKQKFNTIEFLSICSLLKLKTSEFLN